MLLYLGNNKEKKIKKIVIAFSLLLIFVQPVFSRSIEEVANTMGLSVQETEKILIATQQSIREVQAGFSSIGDSEYPYPRKVEKNGLISNLFNYFKDGENSTIEVSSLNNTSINTYNLYNYLYNLAKMSQKDNISVKLTFGNRIRIGDIIREDSTIRLKASVYQIFQKCKKDYEDELTCYSDITKKSFIINIDSDKTVAIESILVEETMTFNEKNNMDL